MLSVTEPIVLCIIHFRGAFICIKIEIIDKTNVYRELNPAVTVNGSSSKSNVLSPNSKPTRLLTTFELNPLTYSGVSNTKYDIMSANDEIINFETWPTLPSMDTF